MTKPPGHALGCTVVDAQKLPAETGGADAICAAMRAAVGERGHGVSVVVRVLSPYSAKATVTTADGRALPDVNVSISDRQLNARSLAMLAEGVAGQLAGANEK